jgi:hypothetical protein
MGYHACLVMVVFTLKGMSQTLVMAVFTCGAVDETSIVSEEEHMCTFWNLVPKPVKTEINSRVKASSQNKFGELKHYIKDYEHVIQTVERVPTLLNRNVSHVTTTAK